MSYMISAIMPLILFLVGLYALMSGIDVFNTFLTGAKKGFDAAIKILPTLVGLLSVVYMLRASGAIDFFGKIFSPFISFLGIPNECTILALLKPISGGGGLALGSDIIREYGADSYIGRVAAVMLGASETSIYTISVYFGYLGIKRARYAIIVALFGDLVAFITSAFFVKFLQ